MRTDPGEKDETVIETRAALFRELATGQLAQEELARLLRSADEAIVHAAVLQLERRLRNGEPLASWQALLPQDLLALPAESQLVLAKLACDGFSRELPRQLEETHEDPLSLLAPAVRLAWLRALLLHRPQSISRFESTALGRHAVIELPYERVIASGLLDRLIESVDGEIRRSSIHYLRQALRHGLISCFAAQDYALKLEGDAVVPIAIEALRFLKEAWSFALPLPRLRIERDDSDVQCELVQLHCARRELELLRRWIVKVGIVEETPSFTLLAALISALGEQGDAADIPSIVNCMCRDPEVLGPVGIAALLALKRRGSSPDDEIADVLITLFLDGPSLDAAAAAEIMSSRSDYVASSIDPRLAERPIWPRFVGLLEHFMTRRAIERIRGILASAEERAGWWDAIRALGRMGITEAEADILARLNDEPEACLYALRFIGGKKTVGALSEQLFSDSDASRTWLGAAAELLFQLEPSPQLFEDLARRGLLTDKLIDSLPAHSTLAQTDAMHAIITQHGHPQRSAAIRALGRTGGPLSVEPLGELLSDPDEKIRDEAIAALRVLGPRLREQGSLRPMGIDTAAHPASALLADAILRRLRERGLEPEVLVRLLDALMGLASPQLVSGVRPYLRSRLPEVRKRAIACLATAGPAAAAWILPWLDDEDGTVSRQAIAALTQLKAPGFSEPIARWLDARNMNLKKCAAEALATLGDRTAVPKLLFWLGRHDNPGFRQLLTAALKAILGPWFVSVIVDRLVDEPDARTQQLLIDALSGELSPVQVAALIRLRGGSISHPRDGWPGVLIGRIHADDCALASGTVVDLDRELAQRALGDRVEPRHLDTQTGTAWRVPALRAGAKLRQILADSPTLDSSLSELALLLHKANSHGQLVAPRLSPSELHALLDAYPQLDAEAQAGTRQILAHAVLDPSFDPVLALRTSRILRALSTFEKVPAALLRSLIQIAPSQLARQLISWPDRQVQQTAAQTLILDERIDIETWPGRDAAQLIEHLVRQGAYDVCFDWCRQKGHLPELVAALHKQEGSAFALAQVRGWLSDHPALVGTIASEVLKLGPIAHAELAQLASVSETELRVREQLLSELRTRARSDIGPALFRQQLTGDHAALREQSAKEFLRIGDQNLRHEILTAFLNGAFRESFSIALDHADLPFLEKALRSAQDPARLRLLRLLEALNDPRKVPLIIELWKASEDELHAKSRDALRAIDPHQVLPFLIQELAAENLSALDILGPLCAIPASFVQAAAHSADRLAWLRFFERMSAAGPLHGPGLAALLSRWFREKKADRAALRLFVRLDDWSQASCAKDLATAIEPALSGSDRESLLTAIVEATERLAITLRVRVLTSLARGTDTQVILALLDALLVSPVLRESIAAPLLIAIDRQMIQEAAGDAERARKILGYRAARAKGDSERTALIDLLERSLQHSAARVRLHAHRLLRTHADPQRYLSATRTLLNDSDPTTVRSAIRVLAFGRHEGAAAELATLLFHSHAAVKSAAREGLLHLGTDAISTLSRSIGQARPDRRPILIEVLDAIERGIAQEDEASDENAEDEASSR